jgi:galactokinase/mevalonate kinase-like predicted kinase
VRSLDNSIYVIHTVIHGGDMPVSIRLDRESEEMLKKMMDSLHLTKSDAVRKAIRNYHEKLLEENKKTPWEIYQAVHAPGGSGHGERVLRTRETLKGLLESKRKQWSS